MMNKLTALCAKLTLMLFWVGCTNSQQEPAQLGSGPVKVALQQIKLTPATANLNYSGTLEADQMVQVSFAVPGIVNRVLVQEGQYVKKGQALAVIDAADYQSSLVIAEAAYEQANDLHKRLSVLYQKGSLPEKEYIEMKTRLAQSEASKKISAKHVADSWLYAPINGVITAKMVEPGSAISVGPAAFTIIKTDVVNARIAVPENEIGALQRGMKVSVVIPTLSETVSGEIHIINPQADAASKTYTVKISIDNAHLKLLPGMLAEVKINTGRDRQVIAIPVNSILRDADELTYVFILNRHNKAIRKRVIISELVNDKVIINSGLQQGENLIIAGQNGLSDGQAATTI